MSRKSTGLLLLLLASLAFGFLASELFFRLSLKAIPPMAMTAVSVGASHLLFLAYGAVLGAAVFGLALLAVALSGVFRSSGPKGPERLSR